MDNEQLILQKLTEIQETLASHTQQLQNIELKKLPEIQKTQTSHTEQLQNIETSIGVLTEWADDVASITKVAFASGQTKVN